MSKILNEGIPSCTKSKERFIEAIEKSGFEAAYRQMLRELKDWFIADPEYRGRSAKIAEQADLIEGGFVFSATEYNFNCVPPIAIRDQIFGEIFGLAGQRLVERKQAEADAEVREFMAETGLSEAEAREALVGEMVGGMQFFVSHHAEIVREADVMEQIEEVIGPVDWRDMGNE